jgi:hypothetical protein
LALRRFRAKISRPHATFYRRLLVRPRFGYARDQANREVRKP